MLEPEQATPYHGLTWALDQPVDWRDKAMPPTDRLVTPRSAREQGWNVLAGDLFFPVVVLHERALEHNLTRMAVLCAWHGVSLAPHAKTYMAPQILARQLELGAWGATVATASQVRIIRGFGMDRVLLANQLVQPAALRWVAGELDADEGFSFYCLADSTAGVALMDETLAAVQPRRRLAVLVELGAPATRAGCRSEHEAVQVAQAVRASRHLELAGVEGYEGVISEVRTDDALAAVDRFLADLRSTVIAIDRQGLFETDELMVSAGGSAWFDRVIADLDFTDTALSAPVRVVLRSGGYATHDHGLYERVSPLRSGATDDPLSPAFELWGEVLSRPEPGLAIVGFGKRDAPHDVDLPLPRQLIRRSGERAVLDGTARVVKLMDQQAFVRLDAAEMAVGDLLGCGISHPCTTFDKWRLIPLVDERYDVIGGIRTFF